MRSQIRDSILLPATADVLYETYMDSVKHAEITGAPVAISKESGSPFSAFNGSISGTTLVAIPARLVVQSWRSTHFNANDPDSTLILSFLPEGQEGRIDLVHLDVPEVDYQGVSEGWGKYYWAPWRRILSAAPG